jgi:3-hydroxymyristoyl/3-hydroxydecanoyl-(acyl carrier protein) dehydratase
MLPPESGIPTVRRELVAGGGSGELVVAGTLGSMGAELDASGGLDTDAVAAALAGREAPLLLVGRVKAALLYGGLVVETTLDPQKQPFLFDHRIEGVPVLPGVMGSEAFAQVASVLVPGFFVSAVEDEQFLAPFKFHRNQPATLHLAATARSVASGEVLVAATLGSIVQPKPELPALERVHFKANVRLRRQPQAEPRVDFAEPAARALELGREAIYEVYFHGPAYQVIERAHVAEAAVVARLASPLPPNCDPATAAALTAPRLLELLFQAAGLWLLAKKETMALPSSLASARFYRPPEPAQERRLYAVVEVRDDGGRFDGRVVDGTGRVYAELVGYQTVALPERRALPT